MIALQNKMSHISVFNGVVRSVNGEEKMFFRAKNLIKKEKENIKFELTGIIGE